MADGKVNWTNPKNRKPKGMKNKRKAKMAKIRRDKIIAAERKAMAAERRKSEWESQWEGASDY